jgi:rubrerythrin
MAEKFKAEAAEAANDDRAQNAQEQTRMMKEFMEQQMQAVRDMSASNTQAMNNMMQAKDREIERTQHMVDKNEDRYAGVIKEQVRSGNNSKVKVCTNCGFEVGNEPFCPECGTRQSEE